MKLFNIVLMLCAIAVSADAAPGYEAREKMGEKEISGEISYLAMDGETIYALETSGKVHAFNAKSCRHENSFETGLENTQSIAVDDKGELYVFATANRQEQRTHNNKKYTVNVPIGVTCKVFSKEGEELRTVNLDDLNSATAAKIVDGTLVVADYGKKTLFFMDPETGEKEREVDQGLRLCCGIFDFCVTPDNTVAVANLGAFQVQPYNLRGRECGREFGERGKDVDEFHGCCNPVSLGYLADGSVVTVEKSPTRVKIYDPRGRKAKEIRGVGELVKGCSHIPIAVNGDDEIFLAARKKGYIVKCVPES